MNIESSKPKKQRKFHYNRPLHKKQACLSGHLDKKLRQSLGRRSVQLRKGDTVKILRGKKKGSSGKITGVDYNKGTVFIEKVSRKKVSGAETQIPVQASNLLVTEVDRGDSKRFKAGGKGKHAGSEGKDASKAGKAGKAD